MTPRTETPTPDPTELLYCVICDEDASTAPTLVIARWGDQWVCTDCLAHKDAMIANGEW